MKNILIGFIALSTLSYAQTISFERSAYATPSDGVVSANVVINPVPIAGLFSGSFLVQVTGPDTVGFSRVTLAPELDFNGPDGAGALSDPGGDTGAAGGTVDFFSPAKEFYQGEVLGTFEAGNFAMDGDYTMTILPNPIVRTPDEVLFVDGNCNPLDDSLTFGSATLTVGIIASVDVIGSPVLDPQSGLFLQTVRLTNLTGAARGDFRVFIDGLTGDVSLRNAHGEEGGLSYVDYSAELAAGASVDLVLEFYSPTRTAPGVLTLMALDATGTTPDPDPAGAQDLNIRSEFDSLSGALLIEFDSVAGSTYVMQYSYDMLIWKTVASTISGTGSRVQWIDNGPPKTDCHPTLCTSRFYRVIEQ